MVTRHATRISTRLFYIILSWFLTCLVAWNEGSDVLLDISFEPWAERWGGETMFYNDPSDLWKAELALAILVSFVLMFPLIGFQIAIFLANGLTNREQRTVLFYWIFSWRSLWCTWIILINYDGINLLRDLSHGDDDDDEASLCTLVYVPSLHNYRYSWLNLRILSSILSQIPIVWYWKTKSRIDGYWNERFIAGKINAIERNREKEFSIVNWSTKCDSERFLFISLFILPILRIILFLIDEIVTAFVVIATFRIVYLRILYVRAMYSVYKVFIQGE